MVEHKTFDAIVLGVGGVGSSACYHLAQRGLRVLGLEQFDIAHTLGSSHGESRLIRQAYFERPEYVPLLRRAYALWEALEIEAQTKLLHKSGLLISGADAPGSIVQGIKHSAALHNIPIDILSAQEAMRRFPCFQIPQTHQAVYEPGAGYLNVEACVRTHAEQAVALGAQIRTQEPALRIDQSGTHISVTTVNGTYESTQLVITAGPWSAQFLPQLQKHLAVHRVPLFWFKSQAGMTHADGTPCFGFELEDGFFYGVPALNARGVKVGLHVPGELIAQPSRLNREVDASELASVRQFVARCLPKVTPDLNHHAACMYTMSPDTDFILDRHGQVSFFAGSSGHGFKFASVLGEILADLVIDGSSQLPIDFLRARW